LGYCPLGEDCKRKHIRRKPCARYMTGFCPYGLDCRDAHLKFLVPLKGPAALPPETRS
jgi:cleavage and polyadenylation specificity factor subunit 4